MREDDRCRVQKAVDFAMGSPLFSRLDAMYACMLAVMTSETRLLGTCQAACDAGIKDPS